MAQQPSMTISPHELSGGSIQLVERAPSPNAGKVFANWLLSREGQQSWQKFVADNSARTDIPKDDVTPSFVPKPGGQYVNVATEEYAQLQGTVITDLITKAIAK